MAIYAISDLHLSFGNNKPMDIFGANWENHYLKIAKDWNEKVNEEDLVIIHDELSDVRQYVVTYQAYDQQIQ